MTQQPDDATPRVVKKVVKKTVARPVSATAPAAGSSRRPARLTSAGRAQAIRSATSPAPATAKPAPTPVRKPATSPTATTVQPAAKPAPARASTTRRRPSLPSLPTLPSLPKPDVRGRVSDLGHAIGDRAVDAWDWLISIRLPHLSPPKGSAITGVIVGLASVGVGWGFYQLFSATRGTQAGGGWGFLAFVFLSFLAFILGELLLSGFGVPHARVVSILSVLLVLLLVLVFFIKLAAGIWAWALIPALCALCFVASTAIMNVVTKEENDQRLPWEPTDQSQVRTD